MTRFPKWMDSWDREKFNHDLLSLPESMATREASLWLARIKKGMKYDLIMGFVSEENYQKFLHALEPLNGWKVSTEKIKEIMKPIQEYFWE